jgi:uncharacterized membrane protein HdeD (DUF308 family)
MLAVGCASVVLGVVLVVWPAATIRTAAVLLAAQILLYAVFCLAQAVVEDRGEPGRRTLLALLGVVGLIVGVLLLRDLADTIELLALLVGLFWTVGGMTTLVTAFFEGDRPARGVRVLTSALGIAVGVLVLAYPSPSLLVLAVILGAWLVVFGVLTSLAAVRTRGAARGGSVMAPD